MSDKQKYERPMITPTERLKPEEIMNLMKNYKRVEDIDELKKNMHLRYFVKKNGVTMFRMGGTLFNNNGLPKYIMLTNGNAVWSVQVEGTIFYRKKTLDEIAEEYEQKYEDRVKEIEQEKNEQIDEYKKRIVELKTRIKHLEDHIKLTNKKK